MCMMFYIGSDIELPLLRSGVGGNSISVEPLDSREDAVRMNFDLPNVCYVGSHEGCGCGFILDPGEDFKEDPLVKKSLGQLADYIELQLGRGAKIQLFAVWDGNQGEKTEVRRKISTAQLRTAEHYLETKELLEIRDLMDIE